jgi:hypothetical protein
MTLDFENLSCKMQVVFKHFGKHHSCYLQTGMFGNSYVDLAVGGNMEVMP